MDNAVGAEVPGLDIWGTTAPAFSFSIRFRDGAPPLAEVRLWTHPEGHRRVIRWGEPWPGDGEPVPVAALLDALTSVLSVLAGGYAHGAPADGEGPPVVVDLGAGLGLDGPVLVASGRRLYLRDVGLDMPFGPDSVCVAEALLCMGDLCALRQRRGAGCDATLAAWEAVRARLDLFPAVPDLVPDGEAAPSGPVEEAWHWADRLGQDRAAYVRAGTWLVARQWLHGAGLGVPEPEGAEWDAAALPPGLPDDAAVHALAARAEAVAGDLGIEDGRTCLSDGLVERNMDARRVVHMRDWPRSFQFGESVGGPPGS